MTYRSLNFREQTQRRRGAAPADVVDVEPQRQQAPRVGGGRVPARGARARARPRPRARARQPRAVPAGAVVPALPVQPLALQHQERAQRRQRLRRVLVARRRPLPLAAALPARVTGMEYNQMKPD